MMTVLSLLLAIFKAIPVLKEAWDELVSAYVAMKIADMKVENREAIRRAFEDHDQRGIEDAIGSPKAGKESNLPGTELRDSLPGVLPDSDKS